MIKAFPNNDIEEVNITSQQRIVRYKSLTI
jgi:hypothetical protein